MYILHFNCLQHLEFPVKVLPQLNAHPRHCISHCIHATKKMQFYLCVLHTGKCLT